MAARSIKFKLDEDSDATEMKRGEFKQPASRIARIVALAHHIEGLVHSGKLRDYAEVARILSLSRARVSQIMNLLMLSPGIQEAILHGRLKTTERKIRSIVGCSEWRRQEEVLRLGKG